MSPAVNATIGQCSRSSALSATSWCRVSAPIAMLLARLRTYDELGDPADVDEQRRPGEAQLHRREERVPAGEELRVLPLAEEASACSALSATS